MASDVTVIGAGAIGIVSALMLRREGHRVTVIDRQAPGEGASFGNAGSLAPSSIVPIALPGTIRQVPKWLRDPLGPLTLSWQQLPKMLPWFLHFNRACGEDRARRAATLLRAMNTPSIEGYAELLAEAGASDLLRRQGMLHVYRREASFNGSAFGRELRRDNGCEFEIVDADRIHALAPGLSKEYRYGFFLPDNAHLAGPGNVVKALAAHLQRIGGVIEQAEVTAIRGAGEGVTLEVGGRTRQADIVVLAAGHASGRFAAQVGTHVPLAPERGYHIQIPGAEPGLHCPVTDGEGRFVATPMAGGLRFAGTSEFQAAGAPPNWDRAEILAKQAKSMFPGLEVKNYSRWMGVRPSTPDSAPVIGRSPLHPGVLFAFGHGHWGLMAAPATGRIVSDLVAGRTPKIDPAPFSAERFGWF